ncbi:NUDIX domain-containing protein [Gammaproteobacteria bacterium]|nr:NUDIX domain-containing protein [Gammaproteobacteria bacterium]
MNNQNRIHVLSRAVIIENNYILLCKNIDLKNNMYFLPGGHIKNEESAEISVIRELKEETGYNFTIKKFLGCIEYIFEPSHTDICHNHEYNLIFETHSNSLKHDTKIIQLEKNINLSWVKLSKLKNIDLRPKSLIDLIHSWLHNKENHFFKSEYIKL